MRPLADLRFIAARVIAEVRANPSPWPLLGESEPVDLVPFGPCKYGHSGLVPKRAGRQRCLVCGREGTRKRRARLGEA